LIEAGADVNSPHADYGYTALFWASARGNKNSVKLLLAQPGIKLDVIDIDGETALMAAVGHGDAEIIEMLLKAGANVSIANKHGDTATAIAQKGLEKQQARLRKQQDIISMLQSRPK
jgi:ankyrin repeat protein